DLIVTGVQTCALPISAVEEHSADVSWLSPRAMSLDRVLTWAQEHGGVIPLPMFSLWASDASLAKSLSTQAKELQRVFERVKGARSEERRVGKGCRCRG